MIWVNGKDVGVSYYPLWGTEIDGSGIGLWLMGVHPGWEVGGMARQGGSGRVQLQRNGIVLTLV